MLQSIRHRAAWRSIVALLLIISVIGFSSVTPRTARAADCLVTSNGDTGPDTLRAALANSDGYANCDTIAFSPGLGAITVSERLLIDRAVTIKGPSGGSQIVQYGGSYAATGSVFQITGGPAVLRGLTIQNGKALGVWGGGISILNAATPVSATLERVTVQNNWSSTGGGGIYISNGTLVLRNSIVSGNIADPISADPRYGGGGVFIGNEYGPVTATIDGGSTFLGNSATHNADGGGILVRRKDGVAAPLQIAITDSMIGSVAQPNTVWNQAGGGGLANGGGTTTLTNVTVSGNAAAAGGGIANLGGTLTLEHVTIDANKAAVSGGGLFTEGTTIINNSTIGNNQAYGTGIGQGFGGGILNAAALTLTNSTISGNLATKLGGGLYNDRSYVVSTLTNVTISGNEAYGAGGGLVNYFGTLALVETTMVGNKAAQGAGIWNYTINGLAGTATSLHQSIVVGNGSADCGTSDPTLAPITSQGYNLIGNGTGCPAVGTDVALTGALATALDPTLADNGGATWTHALIAESPALDLAPAPCAAPTDQRGVARAQGAGCDSGAFELVVNSPAPSQAPSQTPSPSPLPTASPTPTPTPTPSPSATTYTLAVNASAGGTASGGGTFSPGTVTTAQANPAPGYVFLGWTFDKGGAGHLPGAPDGWAPTVSVTMNANHTLVAAFAPIPAFGDASAFGPDRVSIEALTARGIIKGYRAEDCVKSGIAPPCYGPADSLLRSQMAALIVRALGWSNEPASQAPFTDLDPFDPEQQHAVAVLHSRGVARGYSDGTFRPTDPVLQIQVVAFITRGMVSAGYWTAATSDDPSIFPEIAAGSDHRLDIVTFVRNAGAPPGQTLGAPWTDWQQPASRGWMASTLWQALDSHFGRDEPTRGGYIP